MFHARHQSTGRLVDAEDLWDWDEADMRDFVCPDCESTVFPRSYRPENIPRPHFMARPKCPDWCESNGLASLIERARTERIEDVDGQFPGYMPQRLLVDLPERARPAVGGGGEGVVTAMPDGQNAGEPKARRRRPPVTSSFREICRAYIHYPNNRDQPLAIEGIPGSSYDTVFWRLSLSKKERKLIRYRDGHLFYAPIGWPKPIESDDRLVVALDVKEWVASADGKKSVPGRSYQIEVHWADWTTRQRHALLREIETARREAMDAKKEGKRLVSYLFFFGEQQGDDAATVHVTRRRLVCALGDELPAKK